MAYAALHDIRSEMPQLPIHEQSKPSIREVEESILLIESYVNAVLKSRGYTVPITGGVESLKILRKLVRHGVAAQVLRQTHTGIRDQGATGRTEHQRIFDDMLANLYLPDATSGLTEEPFFAGGPTYDEDPVFAREDEY